MPLLGARLPLHWSKMFPRVVLHAPTLSFCALSAQATSPHVGSNNSTQFNQNSKSQSSSKSTAPGPLISSVYPPLPRNVCGLFSC